QSSTIRSSHMADLEKSSTYFLTSPKWFPPSYMWVLALLVALSVLDQSWKVTSFFVIFFSLMSVQWIKWVWPLKHVTIEGDYFCISDYLVSHRVPFAHLTGLTEIRAIRDNGSRYSKYYLDNDTHEVRYMASPTPAIDLYFDPPTPFGKHVRFIPPSSLFDREPFNEALTFLLGLLNDQERRRGAKTGAN
ncbi:MAG: hypothetical protein J2P21_31795, partial [Chloracidobacterium sp.]|nr:hypothetical protein [Chloracidobacterium sp.]